MPFDMSSKNRWDDLMTDKERKENMKASSGLYDSAKDQGKNETKFEGL